MKSFYLFFISTLVFNTYCMEHRDEPESNKYTNASQIISEYCIRSIDGLELFDAIDKAIYHIEKIKLLYGKTSLKLIYSITNLFKKILAEKYATEYSDLPKEELNDLLIKYLKSQESIRSSCIISRRKLPEFHEIEVAKLIIAGADIDLQINYNISPKKLTLLEYIIEQNIETKLIRMLIFYNADVNSDPTTGYLRLSKAISKKNLEIVELLIDCGVDLSMRNPKTNATLLIDAMIQGSEFIAELLLENPLIKEDINQSDNFGYTVLDYAIEQLVETQNFRLFDIIKNLLENGALINLSPVNIAMKYCHYLSRLRETAYTGEFKNIFKRAQVVAMYPELRINLRLDE